MVMATKRQTTVTLAPETRERLREVKIHPRETVDDVVRRALAALEREQRESAKQGRDAGI